MTFIVINQKVKGHKFLPFIINHIYTHESCSHTNTRLWTLSIACVTVIRPFSYFVSPSESWILGEPYIATDTLLDRHWGPWMACFGSCSLVTGAAQFSQSWLGAETNRSDFLIRHCLSVLRHHDYQRRDFNCLLYFLWYTNRATWLTRVGGPFSGNSFRGSTSSVGRMENKVIKDKNYQCLGDHTLSQIKLPVAKGPYTIPN